MIRFNESLVFYVTGNTILNIIIKERTYVFRKEYFSFMVKDKKHVLIAGLQDFTQNYQAALHSSGMECEVSLFLNDISTFDGLLIPGGGDIDPSYFHQHNLGSRNINAKLDEKQISLMDAFVKAEKPILGICKGMQIINVYFGGDIIQNLKTSKTHAFNELDMVHHTRAVKGSFIQHLYGNTLFTNSAHHQGCGLLGRNLLPAQYAYDEVLEALYHTKLPIIAVQWHPERMAYQFRRSDTVDGAPLFCYFKSLL